MKHVAAQTNNCCNSQSCVFYGLISYGLFPSSSSSSSSSSSFSFHFIIIIEQAQRMWLVQPEFIDIFIHIVIISHVCTRICEFRFSAAVVAVAAASAVDCVLGINCLLCVVIVIDVVIRRMVGRSVANDSNNNDDDGDDDETSDWWTHEIVVWQGKTHIFRAPLRTYGSNKLKSVLVFFFSRFAFTLCAIIKAVGVSAIQAADTQMKFA